jgi:hypothetical protein
MEELKEQERFRVWLAETDAEQRRLEISLGLRPSQATEDYLAKHGLEHLWTPA